MKVAFEDKFQRDLLKLRKRNLLLYRKVKEKINLFQLDQQSNGLRLHKLKGNLDVYWSMSIEKNFRLIFCYTPEGAVFVDMGTHDQVYKK